MSEISPFLLLLLLHYIADYPLQGSFLAVTKSTQWYSLWAHSVIYGLLISCGLSFLGAYAFWKVLILVGSHIAIDYWKSHAKDKSKQETVDLYIDQASHIIINIAMYIS